MGSLSCLVLAPDPSCHGGDTPNLHGGIQPPDPLGQVPQAATRAATRSCFPGPHYPQMPLRCRAVVVPCCTGSLSRLGTHGGAQTLPSLLPCLKSLFPSLSLSFSVPSSSSCPSSLPSLSVLPLSLSRSLCWRRFSQLCSAHCQDVPAEPTVLALPAQPGPFVPMCQGGAGRSHRRQSLGRHRGSQAGWGRL